MVKLLRTKFQQVPEFQAVLEASHGSLLLEATMDRFWGVGLTQPQAETVPLAALPGKNVLGWLLMAVWDAHTVRGTST